MPRSAKTQPPTITFKHSLLLYFLTNRNAECLPPPTREEIFSIFHDDYQLLSSRAHLEKLLLELQRWKPPLVMTMQDVYRPYIKGRTPNVYLPAPTLAQHPLTGLVALHVFYRSKSSPLPFSHLGLRAMLQTVHNISQSEADSHIHLALVCGYITLHHPDLTTNRPHRSYRSADATREQMFYLLALTHLKPQNGFIPFEDEEIPVTDVLKNMRPEILMDFEKRMLENLEPFRDTALLSIS